MSIRPTDQIPFPNREISSEKERQLSDSSALSLKTPTHWTLISSDNSDDVFLDAITLSGQGFLPFPLAFRPDSPLLSLKRDNPSLPPYLKDDLLSSHSSPATKKQKKQTDSINSSSNSSHGVSPSLPNTVSSSSENKTIPFSEVFKYLVQMAVAEEQVATLHPSLPSINMFRSPPELRSIFSNSSSRSSSTIPAHPNSQSNASLKANVVNSTPVPAIIHSLRHPKRKLKL